MRKMSFESEQIKRTALAARKLAERKKSPTKRPNRYKMLSADEERELALAWRDHGDAKAAEQLVLPYRPLVWRIATQHRHYLKPESPDIPDPGAPPGRSGSTSVEELAQEGLAALISAVRTFDPEIGVRLHYHARPRITGAIRDFIMRNYSHVKIGTKRQEKALFWGLPRFMSRTQNRLLNTKRYDDPCDVFDEAVRLPAKHFDVKPWEVIGMIARTYAGGDKEINAPRGKNEEGTADDWLDFLWCHNDNPEKILIRKEEMALARTAISDALDILTARERRIFMARWLVHPDDKITLDTLGREFKVSAQRIRAIEQLALKKMRQALANRADDLDDLADYLEVQPKYEEPSEYYNDLVHHGFDEELYFKEAA
jgi:RNA polymerase sigma-32 factor